MTRLDARAADALRPVTITPNVIVHPEGSVMIEVGRTRVICTASVEEKALPQDSSATAARDGSRPEYGMLPRATNTRTQREGFIRQSERTLSERFSGSSAAFAARSITTDELSWASGRCGSTAT